MPQRQADVKHMVRRTMCIAGLYEVARFARFHGRALLRTVLGHDTVEYLMMMLDKSGLEQAVVKAALRTARIPVEAGVCETVEDVVVVGCSCGCREVAAKNTMRVKATK